MTPHIPNGLAFEVDEYRQRQERVRAVLAARGIDVLYVTSPSNLYYLTGYVASWYPPRLPVGLAIHRSDPRIVFFDWTRHVDYVDLITLYDEAEFFDYGTAAHCVATALAARDWAGGSVALEWYSPTPVAAVVNSLADALTAGGSEVVSGDWIVDNLRLYKSPSEIERIRRASAILDDSFTQLASELRAGMTELEIASRLAYLLAERGSEVAAQHPLVSSGPSAWADVHAFPSRRVIQSGDIVSIDASAVIDRYHVNLSRAFAIDTMNELARDLLERTQSCVDTLLSEAVLGEGPERAMSLAEQQLRSTIPAENIWWVGGYSLGLAFPPSWVGHTYLANDGLEKVVLDPGYLSNFETVIFDREQGFEACAIDTVLMTEHGLVVLSTLPRALLLVGENVEHITTVS
ncbi:Xaa-Pro peptidase family protein [soil metagenome]